MMIPLRGCATVPVVEHDHALSFALCLFLLLAVAVPEEEECR